MKEYWSEVARRNARIYPNKVLREEVGRKRDRRTGKGYDWNEEHHRQKGRWSSTFDAFVYTKCLSLQQTSDREIVQLTVGGEDLIGVFSHAFSIRQAETPSV